MKPILVLATCLLAIFITAPIAFAQKVADGFYKASTKGTPIRTVTGEETHLGSRRDVKGLMVNSLHSENNANTMFKLLLMKEGASKRELADLVLCVADICTPLERWGEKSGYPERRSSLIIGAGNLPRSAIDAYGRFFQTTVKMRANPGHKLAMRFIPAKESFDKKDVIAARMELVNVGTVDITFWTDGVGGGTDPNFGQAVPHPCRAMSQSNFTAEHDGPMPESVPLCVCECISYPQTLKPGESFTRNVDLRDWFRFDTPGVYHVHGSFSMDIYASPRDISIFKLVIWTDQPVADFDLIVR